MIQHHIKRKVSKPWVIKPLKEYLHDMGPVRDGMANSVLQNNAFYKHMIHRPRAIGKTRA